jgi:hypothetical protein
MRARQESKLHIMRLTFHLSYIPGAATFEHGLGEY